MPSDVSFSLVAVSERVSKGKVRRVLLRGSPADADHLAAIVVESTLPTLQFYSKGETQVIKLGKNILDLSWIDIKPMNLNPLLVVLYEDGQVCIHPVDFECGSILGASLPDFERQVERPPGKVHGCLDCFGSVIAFSLGNDVHAYSTSSNAADPTFFSSLERYVPGRVFVTAVHITATNSVLAFVAGVKEM